MNNQQEVDLYESGNAPRVTNVKVGDKIKAKDKNEDEEEQIITWRVRRVHPFLVYATAGSRHRCFNYGDLVCMGLEGKYTANYREEKNDEGSN